MINEISAKRFCSEDIALIENYKQAITDQTRTWDIHHRRECDSEGRTLFTRKLLKDMNLYYKRPASELIFVTRSMHSKLHRELRSNGGKIGGKISGKIVGKITGKKNGAINGKKNAIPILQFTKSGEFIKEWPSAREAYRQLGINYKNICNCLKGRRESAGGYIWRYAHE